MTCSDEPCQWARLLSQIFTVVPQQFHGFIDFQIRRILVILASIIASSLKTVSVGSAPPDSPWD
jgi:hypothetical protein